jgi:transcriptional regulator with XRE-family HTH domain
MGVIRMIINELENFVYERISQLRMNNNVSARDLSLSIGQGAGYIHAIESKKSLPSMRGLFYICEYFNITPKDFFDADSNAPEKLNKLITDLKSLTPEQLENISRIVNDIKK